ncbi:hypothetical protein GQ53DRAFT_217526 [Thozetella sp. PMI_491]|nr:hypothetical protein GQ53DRAFT_217526 [Thozetella sp. PMI_491]
MGKPCKPLPSEPTSIWPPFGVGATLASPVQACKPGKKPGPTADEFLPSSSSFCSHARQLKGIDLSWHAWMARRTGRVPRQARTEPGHRSPKLGSPVPGNWVCTRIWEGVVHKSGRKRLLHQSLLLRRTLGGRKIT